MTYKKRTLLFLGLMVLFLIVAPSAVLYSLGWRFDWETKKIIQPGLFYFKTWPKNADVYLNGKFRKKTDLFFGSILIENLRPQKYNVEIKKTGYHTWQKNLEIKKRKVTEAKNIILIRQNPRFDLISKNIEDFFFSPDKKKIILKERNEQGWDLKLFETDKNVKSHLLSKDDISKEKVQIIDLEFSPDSKKILLEFGVKEKVKHYLLELDKSPPALVSLGFLAKPEEFFLESPLKKEVINFAVLNKDIYYLDKNGFLWKNEQRLNIIPLEIKQETKYQITVSETAILLEEGNTLYIFNKEERSFKKLFEPIEKFKFSPDLKKLAYANGHEIWVLFLEKIIDMPQKEKGEKLFITRFSEKIENIFWYTNHYLVFNVGNKIKVAEIDDRDKINIIDLTEFKNPRIFWADKKIYVLSQENLYVSEELIP